MKALAELVIAALELVEAEARDLKHGAFRLALAVSLLAVATLLAAGGVTLIAIGVFVFLQNRTSTVTAAIICGLALLAGAGAIAWQAQRMTK